MALSGGGICGTTCTHIIMIKHNDRAAVVSSMP